MKKTKIIYYVFTAVFSLSILMGAYFELAGDKMSQEAFAHMGYPLYFGYILGVAKILGVIGLWQTISPTLKEWAYAGFFFDLICAVISIMAVGDPFSATIPAWVSLLFVAISYATYRKLKASHSDKEITKIRA